MQLQALLCHAPRKQNVICTLILTLVFLACASERSAQDENREKENRENLRLRKAEGLYQGYATQNSRDFIPTRLTIKVLQNPGSNGDDPTLQVTLTIGLFGGVTLTSDATSFDWKTGELNAGFYSGSNGVKAFGKGIELQASIKSDYEITDAQIKGSQSGDFELNLKKYSGSEALATQLYRYFFSTETDTEAFLASPKAEGLGVVSLKRLENTVFTSPTSDLPVLPGLEAAFRFFGLADTPEVAKGVEYDPLTGILEARLVSGASIIFRNLFSSGELENPYEMLAPNLMSGQVYFGSDPRMPFTLSRVMTYEDLTPADLLPPKSFVGTYQGAGGGLTWNLLAHIDYLGGSSRNTDGEAAFTFFPKLRMRLVTCLGGRPYNTKILDLNYVDQVKSFVRFQAQAQSGLKILELNYARHWKHLEGTLVERGQEGSDRPRTSIIRLQSLDRELTEGCNYFEKP